jgi:hypothetical protein
MILSSSSMLSSIFSVVVKLTGDFTLLEEPADDSDLPLSRFSLPMDPISSDLKGELNPRHRHESSDFRSSGPSLDPNLQRPEPGLVDAVENLRSRRISGF